jgi:4-amino-4-deoxychorismate lyase
MILVNGCASADISVNDRGFQYGDGLFETVEVLNGRAVFLGQHIERLISGCSRLKLPAPDIGGLVASVNDLCKYEKAAVLKIIMTRGCGGRGYRQPDSVAPTLVLSISPFPEHPESYSKQGIVARFCATPLGLNPALAGVKHLNRLEQVMARAEWDSVDIQEGIMLDGNNHVIEGTMTNLFYITGGAAFTATLRCAGVAGIIRTILMQLLSQNSIKIVEHDFCKETLLAADEVFVCNSIIGIWPVKQIENVTFQVGDMTQQLQSWLADFKAKQLADAY